MIHADILDPSPVPPPGLSKSVMGKPMAFAEVVRLAGMPDVVSTNTPPLVTIHAGERDLKVPTPGRPVYCVGGATLPATTRARAREIMRRLAYGYLDWAARETVSRYHRDLKRAAMPSAQADGLPPIVKIRRLARLRAPNKTGAGALWLMAKPLLPDDLWDTIAPLLPPPRPRPQGGAAAGREPCRADGHPVRAALGHCLGAAAG